jgi:hypothetical protein
MASKFDLKKPLLDMEGKATEVNLNKLLADTLMRSSSSEPMKLFEIALKLAGDGQIELDSTDKETLIKFIKSSEHLTVLAKGRLLEVIK